MLITLITNTMFPFWFLLFSKNSWGNGILIKKKRSKNVSKKYIRSMNYVLPFCCVMGKEEVSKYHKEIRTVKRC